MRKNSATQFSFKPQINPISRVIVHNKRSNMANSTLKDIQTLPESDPLRTLPKKKSQSIFASGKTKEKNCRLGHRLYEQAIAQRTKAKERERQLCESYQQNKFKITRQSDYIVENIRISKIKEVFELLAKGDELDYHTLKLKDPLYKQPAFRLFYPLIEEMLMAEISLNWKEFFEASMRLLKYLSPQQKIQLMSLGQPIEVNAETVEQVYINSKSQSMLKNSGYQDFDIYKRGLIRKRKSKDKVERGKEEKVRQQLNSCTFKPKINVYKNQNLL